SAARRALSRAVSHQGRADTDPDVPQWARFAGPFEIDYATAELYMRAGQPKRAVPFLHAAVRGIGRDLARNSASYRVRLACALLAAGEVGEACEEMRAVLDTCGGIASPRLSGRIREFARATARVDNAGARECSDRIRESVLGDVT
ncbi:hypothetical protein ABT104_31390, partial [Streptomyces mobaraensis]